MSNTIEKRNSTFQFLYTLGIVFIVMGHKGGWPTLLEKWFPLYSFHVVLFVFCSGYFYNDKWEKNVISYIFRKIKKLLVPLFGWNLFYAVLLIVLNSNGFNYSVEPVNFHSLFVSPLLHGHQYLFNLAGWFVAP